MLKLVDVETCYGSIRGHDHYGRGKQSDGSARTREVKLVTVWSAEGRDKEGIPVRDLVTILGQFDPKLVKMAPHGERAED